MQCHQVLQPMVQIFILQVGTMLQQVAMLYKLMMQPALFIPFRTGVLVTHLSLSYPIAETGSGEIVLVMMVLSEIHKHL